MPLLISRLYNFVNDKNNGIAITSSRVDAELNQLVSSMNQSVIISASAPSSPINGEIWVDSTNKFVKQYRNAEWVIMGVVHYGTVMATPQSGDIWIDNSGSEVVINYRNKANTAWIVILDANTAGGNAVTTGDIIPSGASTRAGCLLCDGSAVSRSTYAALFTAIGTNFGVGDGSTTFNVPNLPGRTLIGAGTGISIGTISNVNTGTDQLTITANNSVYTGSLINYVSTGSAIGGLTSGVNYYAIRISSTIIQLATTLANALAGTAIDLTSGGSGTQTVSITLTTRSVGDQVGEETHASTISEMAAHTHVENTNTGGTVGSGQPVASNNGSPSTGGITASTGGSGAHNNIQPSLAVNWFIKT